jgi:hypothetical protein
MRSTAQGQGLLLWQRYPKVLRECVGLHGQHLNEKERVVLKRVTQSYSIAL